MGYEFVFVVILFCVLGKVAFVCMSGRL